jgi:hypothetical protein
MSQTLPHIPEADAETLGLRQANAEARALLANLAKELSAVLEDEPLRDETPIEVWTELESAVQTIGAALRRLEASDTTKRPPTARSIHGPTRRQGQFLAFIREYMLRNHAGVAPSHADMQRFFNLSPPSVNSMLIRLEQRGFVRRVPGKARAIELLIPPGEIPPLDRPFKF